EKPCDTERIKQLVLDGVQKKRPIRRIKPKYFIICTAAVLTAVSGLTVAAATDGFGHFRSILHRTEPNANISEELPLMNDSEVSGMEQNISESRIVFTGSDSMTVSTAGMYYDNNTLMLSLEMKLNDDISVPDNALAVPYFTKIKDGVRTELTNQSGLANTARLTKGDAPSTYYVTFYLTEKGLSDSKIGITLINIITTDDASDIYSALIAEQESWRNAFDLDSHTVEEWKQYWKDNDFDKRTHDFVDARLVECSSIVAGKWSAELDISDIDGAATFSKDGFTVTADTLSLTLDIEQNLPDTVFAVPIVTMKDGTVIFDGGTSEENWLAQTGVISPDENCMRYAHRFSNVFSYSEPHKVSSIAEISVYVFESGSDGLTANRHMIYEAEATS
ncbi:MAG: hypothetical protein IKW96_12650, partial [Ruminococcus sp.]|uniref:hypothetical protein n=1 Tax=Ruminococcus sp. TaxID=41978 RepID=UPI0025EFBE75